MTLSFDRYYLMSASVPAPSSRRRLAGDISIPLSKGRNGKLRCLARASEIPVFVIYQQTQGGRVFRVWSGHCLGHITDPGREFLIGNSGKSTPNIVSTQFLQKLTFGAAARFPWASNLARGARWLAWEVLEPTLVAAILPIRGHCLEESESRICEPAIVVASI